MGRYYKEYADFLADHFPGRKMQKLTVDAGFSCPNRDGTLSHGGCVYCNNASFSPIQHRDELLGGLVASQLADGKKFFGKKYPSMRYLAYFQSYTNTHGGISDLMALYDEALNATSIDGLIIGTRPDCLPVPLLEALAERKRKGAWIMFELGAESSHDITLERINRCHTWHQTVEAVGLLKQFGFPVGLHFIMGLPGETTSMMLETVRNAASLNIDTIKFHQLQIIRGSLLGKQYESATRDSAYPSKTDITPSNPLTPKTDLTTSKPLTYKSDLSTSNPLTTKTDLIASCHLFSPEEYIELCVEIIAIMNREAPFTAIERFTSSAPADLLLAPRWGLKNYQFVNLLHNRLNKAK